MKRLLYLSALLCAFVFVSCQDDKNEGVDEWTRKSGTFLSMENQISAFDAAFIEAARSVDFSGLGQAVAAMVQSFAADTIDIISAIQTIKSDELAAAKIMAISGGVNWEEEFKEMLGSYKADSLDEDGILNSIFKYSSSYASDLDNIFLGLDIEMVDSLIGDTLLLKKAVVKEIIHDIDHYAINVSSSGHKFLFGLKFVSDDTERIVVSSESASDTVFSVCLPSMLNVWLDVDGENAFSFQGNLSTDFVANGKLLTDNDRDSITTITLNGSYLNVGCNGALGSTACRVGVNYSNDDGIAVKASLLSGNTEIFTANVGVEAALTPGVNWKEPVMIGLWALSAVKSVNVDAVMGGDMIKVVGGYDQNPVAAIISVAGSQPEEMVDVIDSLNAHFTCDIFFKGYTDAQAKLKFAYKTPDTPAVQPENNTQDGSVIGLITQSILNSGIYVAVETFDSKGNDITVPAKEYFTKIDMRAFKEEMSRKFNSVFAEVLAPLFGVSVEEFDMTDIIMSMIESVIGDDEEFEEDYVEDGIMFED